nr:hypothetical protein [Tanacetum cinerariifolium]
MSSYNHFGCSWCGGPYNGGNCPGCSSVGFRNEFVYDPNSYSYNETPNFFNQPPQHQYETYSCELCGDSPQYGFDCQIRTSLVYEQDPCNNQIFSNDQSPYYSPSQPQQFDYCESSVDDLVLILRETEMTLVYDDLECSMPINIPLPCTDVLGDTIVDIDLPFGEHLDTLSMRDKEIDFNPNRDIEELDRLLVDDLVPVPRVFNKPLGHSDLISRSFDPRPPVSTPVIDESSLLVTPRLALKQLSLRKVERFDLFFSLTQSGEETRVMETPSLGFHHMPSPRPGAYLPKEVMYRFYHPYLTSGDGFDHGTKMK